MFKRIQTLPKHKQHFYSLAFSVFCMTAAAGFSFLYLRLFDKNPVNVTLIFIFFLILVACGTVKYLYDILCSLFSVLWLCYACDLSLNGYSLTFLGMSAVTLLMSALTSHIAAQSTLITKHEKHLLNEDMEKIRANLLRAISHDLRTPLASIMGNSLILLDNYQTLDEKEIRKIISYVHEDSNWLINMAENLLAVTRIKNDDLAIVSRDEIVEEVVGEALQKIEKRHPGCIIRARIPEDFIILPMDAVLIEQVIINLLENALSHSGSGDAVDLIVEDGTKKVSFTVRDYGQGIPEEMLDKLFDGTPCTAAHNADSQKGMGIGLVICKTITAAHRGSIIGRNCDHGAEFVFTLPKKQGG